MTETIAELTLADWRRQIAELYAEVRQLARANPGAALDHWRRIREELFRTHPDSPVLPADRAAFVARHFPADPALRFEVQVVPDAGEDPASAASAAISGGGLAHVVPISFAAPTLELPTSGGGGMAFRRIGWVDVPFPAGTRRLAVYWMEGYAGGLFLPFRDATNRTETYGAGRYLLDAAKSADLGGDPGRGTLVIDFNFAYQPSCAFDPRWSCPLAPRENWLDLPVRAGERIA
jgi:uncharacterized protein